MGRDGSPHLITITLALLYTSQKLLQKVFLSIPYVISIIKINYELL